MRICLFTPNFLPAVGGTELVTDALARQFHAKGHDVVVLAQGDALTLDVPYPVQWFGKPLLPRVRPERVGGALADLHRKRRFDLFAANYAHPTGYAALRVGQGAGVPTVIVSHGGDLYRTSNDRRRPHLWKRTVYAYSHADGLIAISPYIRQLILEINPNPRCLVLIPNGVDVKSLRAPASPPTDFSAEDSFLLCLGNLGAMKGFDDAIEAYAQVRRGLGDKKLVVVGSGEMEARLRRQAEVCGVGRDVLFMGQRTGNDKRWFLQNCRFGLMPSIEEGHPIVALEYLAAGKPLVCSTNAAFDGMYDHGVNAFRAPAKRPERLATEILRMNGGDLEAMGAESLRRARGYAWSAIAERYLRFFKDVISSRR